MTTEERVEGCPHSPGMPGAPQEPGRQADAPQSLQKERSPENPDFGLLASRL